MALLYANENFSAKVVQILRETYGHDVLTSLEADNANRRIEDSAVLAFALNNRRAVVTLNRKHFEALHKEGRGHAGIIICHVDRDSERLARNINDRISEVGNLDGQLLKVHR